MWFVRRGADGPDANLARVADVAAPATRGVPLVTRRFQLWAGPDIVRPRGRQRIVDSGDEGHNSILVVHTVTG